VVFDEPHAAHVRGEVINLIRSPGGPLAVLSKVQVEREILDVVEPLIPLIQRLDVHGTDLLVALFAEVRHQASADETPGTSYHGEFVFHNKRLFYRCSLTARRTRPAGRRATLSPDCDNVQLVSG